MYKVAIGVTHISNLWASVREARKAFISFGYQKPIGRLYPESVICEKPKAIKSDFIKDNPTMNDILIKYFVTVLGGFTILNQELGLLWLGMMK